MIEANDQMMAAKALAQGTTVVTNNEKEYSAGAVAEGGELEDLALNALRAWT